MKRQVHQRGQRGQIAPGTCSAKEPRKSPIPKTYCAQISCFFFGGPKLFCHRPILAFGRPIKPPGQIFKSVQIFTKISVEFFLNFSLKLFDISVQFFVSSFKNCLENFTEFHQDFLKFYTKVFLYFFKVFLRFLLNFFLILLKLF